MKEYNGLLEVVQNLLSRASVPHVVTVKKEHDGRGDTTEISVYAHKGLKAFTVTFSAERPKR